MNWREFDLGKCFDAQNSGALTQQETAYRFGLEASGAEVPWRARHFPETAKDLRDSEKRKREKDADFAAAMTALTFQQLWDHAYGRVQDLELRTETLAQIIQIRLTQLRAQQADIEARAGRLDGELVYLNAQGQLVNAKGIVSERSPEEAAWPDPGNKARVDELRNVTAALEDMTEAAQRLGEITIEIGGARGALADAKGSDNPDTVLEIENALQSIDDELDALQSVLDASRPIETPVPPDTLPASPGFERARSPQAMDFPTL